MNHLRDRRLNAEIATIRIHAGVISEALGVAAKIDLIVGLIEVARTQDQLGFIVSFKTGARSNIEYTVGTIPVGGAVASALDFEVVDILGIELRAEVRGDIGVGNRNAIDQPTGLMASTDVQLIVGEIGAGNVVRDHCQTVGAHGPRGALDISTAYDGCGRDRIGWGYRRRSRDVDRLISDGHA